MYKHHSYNNLIEKKLEQLPGPDTDSLWSGMEAMLNQHMPQKKRRTGLMGWLFTHKAWMLVAFSAVSVAGLCLVYFAGNDSLAAQRSSAAASTPEHQTQAAAGTSSEVTSTTAAATTITTTTKPTNNTNISAAAPVAARTQTDLNASDLTTAQENEQVPADQPANTGAAVATSSAGTTQAASLTASAEHTEAANTTAINWATTTQAIAHQQKAAPMVDPDAVAMNTESLEHLSQNIAATAAAKKPGRLPEEKGPYAGVVAGIDMSSVGFGSMKTGNNTGIILGYAFNNRWSVESGLLWDKKKYSGEGSSYNPIGYTPRPGVTMLSVNSVAQLYEWPVNVRYNILTGNHKLFVTTGVSSYYMKKESFDLKYRWNGTEYNEYNSYRNASKNWLSIANLSLGYTHKLGGFGSIRVEPYLKLPLRDVGTGNMRVTSTGLNVGFTRMLKR